MTEIIEKVYVGEKEVESKIDTGADISMFSEEILLLEGKHVGRRPVVFGDKAKEERDFYVVDLKIRNCKIPLVTVVAGNKNILGRDILERSKAKIDEEKGIIDFPECPGIIEM